MTDELRAAQQELTRRWSEVRPKSYCTCSHTGDGENSDHGGLIGHGPCCSIVSECVDRDGQVLPHKCAKFRWRGWLPEFETALNALAEGKTVDELMDDGKAGDEG